ncbi:hypothetical protein BJX70DRAFT_409559 [Aspergillus crustosus]
MTASQKHSTLPFPPPGTPLRTKTTPPPTLFTPLQIRTLTLQNRFVVSPMGTWSASHGHLTPFHLAHYGQFALRGAALVLIEATSVTANGRTSPQDAGLWQESQIAPLKSVVEFVHGLGQKVGVQLGHGGRKAGMPVPAFVPSLPVLGPGVAALDEAAGWPDDVWGPSEVRYSEAYPMPKVLSVEGIEGVIQAFADAAERAVKAGADLIELHAAHGYLIHLFLSPLSNTRTDEYGGSFENRIRFLTRIIEAIRRKVPESIILSIRISATDWMEYSGKPSWTLEQSIRLAKLLPDLGVDILDVSSGGLVAEQNIKISPTYQSDLAGKIRRALRESGLDLLIATVGFIDSPEVAKGVVQEGTGQKSQTADLAFVGRQLLREPGFVLRCAQELGVDVEWPYQYVSARPKGI